MKINLIIRTLCLVMAGLFYISALGGLGKAVVVEDYAQAGCLFLAAACLLLLCIFLKLIEPGKEE